MHLNVVARNEIPTQGQKAPMSVAKLRAILEDAGMRKKGPEETFETFEKRLHQQLQEVERDLLAEELERADVDADAIEVEGTGYRRVLRAAQTYMTTAGPVTVERALFKDRSNDHEHCIVPLDLKVGMVDGFWTPMAAQQATWVVSQMTPQTGEELFPSPLIEIDPATLIEIDPGLDHGSWCTI